jgi:hypothetical protein
MTPAHGEVYLIQPYMTPTNVMPKIYDICSPSINQIDTIYIWDKISQQLENCENRNDPDLVQAFLKKWWVESDFKAPNLPLSLRFIKKKFQ